MLFRSGLFKSGQTNAIHAGMNYNFSHDILGYDIGYWTKSGRLGLTYGINFNYRTNFSLSSIGLSPVIGFNFFQFHLETGYSFYNRSVQSIPANQLFVGVRYTLMRDRKLKVN